MKELAEWLERLRPTTSESPENPIVLRRVLHRLAAPSDLNFDTLALQSLPQGVEQFSIGALPERLCLLVWADRASAGGVVSDMTIASQIGAAFTLATGRRVGVASSEINIHYGGL